tara:strand:- start:2552 stop:2824 length:273 start_codon:yes stop_codon:yes gene_type:complete
MSAYKYFAAANNSSKNKNRLYQCMSEYTPAAGQAHVELDNTVVNDMYIIADIKDILAQVDNKNSNVLKELSYERKKLLAEKIQQIKNILE